MIPCRHILTNNRFSVGLDACEQDRALHLRARDRHAVIDRAKPAAGDEQRRAPLVALDLRTHARERLDHPAHRSAAQGLVAGDAGCKGVGREHTREQPESGARVAGIELGLRCVQSAKPTADNTDGRSGPGSRCLCLDVHSQAAEASQGRRAVRARRIVVNHRPAVRQGGQKRIAMRNGLVTGHTDRAADAGGRLHDGLRQCGHPGNIARRPQGHRPLATPRIDANRTRSYA